MKKQSKIKSRAQFLRLFDFNAVPVFRKLSEQIEHFRKTGLNDENKAAQGFYRFAFLPTKITNGKIIWLQFVFYAGTNYSCFNRYSVGHPRYELSYIKSKSL